MSDRLWIKLDAHFFEDARIEGLSIYARELYLRGLCHAKRADSGGTVSVRAVRALTTDSRHWRRLAGALVDAGLWSGGPTQGYTIVAWGSWNEAHSSKASERGRFANHARWHRVAAHQECEFCPPVYSDSESPPDPTVESPVGVQEQSRAEQSSVGGPSGDRVDDAPPADPLFDKVAGVFRLRGAGTAEIGQVMVRLRAAQIDDDTILAALDECLLDDTPAVLERRARDLAFAGEETP